jgi:uncharacterized protein (DUF4415 family)
MNWSVPVGDFAPAIAGLLVVAFAWVIILLEKRRRRLAATTARPSGQPSPGAPHDTDPIRQSLPLSREVFDYFRATGPGWQARIDEVLRRHVRDEEERTRRRVAETQTPYRSEGEGID